MTVSTQINHQSIFYSFYTLALSLNINIYSSYLSIYTALFHTLQPCLQISIYISYLNLSMLQYICHGLYFIVQNLTNSHYNILNILYQYMYSTLEGPYLHVYIFMMCTLHQNIPLCPFPFMCFKQSFMKDLRFFLHLKFDIYFPL